VALPEPLEAEGPIAVSSSVVGQSYATKLRAGVASSRDVEHQGPVPYAVRTEVKVSLGVVGSGAATSAKNALSPKKK
jgi:hypothetical protein